jgi:hypothetical protein
MRYKHHLVRDSEGPTFSRLEPVIPVRLQYNDKRVAVVALVDSGADSCLFHSSIGRALGIDIKTGRVEVIKGLTLDLIPAYVHQVHLVLQGEPGVDIEVGFLDMDLLPDRGLLGQIGFFDEADVRFQRWQNAIHIHRRRGWAKTTRMKR